MTPQHTYMILTLQWGRLLSEAEVDHVWYVPTLTGKLQWGRLLSEAEVELLTEGKGGS